MDIINRLGIDTNKSKNSKITVNKFISHINDKSFNIGFENLLLTNSINEIIDSRVKANGESFKDKAREIGSKIIDKIIALWNKFKILFIKLKNKFLNLKLVAKINSILKRNKKTNKREEKNKASTTEEIEIDYPLVILVHEDLQGAFAKDSKLMYSTPFLEQLRSFSISFINIFSRLNEVIKISDRKGDSNPLESKMDELSLQKLLSDIKETFKNKKALEDKIKNLKNPSSFKELTIYNEMQVGLIKAIIDAQMKFFLEKLIPRFKDIAEMVESSIGMVDNTLVKVKENISSGKYRDTNNERTMRMLQATLSSFSANVLENFNVIITSTEKYLSIYDFDINKLVIEAHKKKKGVV